MQQGFDAVTHLGGGLVGEGDRQNGMGGKVLLLDQPGNAMHQHPSFAATGTGQHQKTIRLGGNCLCLGTVKRLY